MFATDNSDDISASLNRDFSYYTGMSRVGATVNTGAYLESYHHGPLPASPADDISHVS